MKHVLSFVPILLILFNCSAQKNATGQSGISGRVLWLEGNLMPSISDTSYSKRAQGTPKQKTVYIYEATQRHQVVAGESGSIYKDISSRLITKTKTDKSGYFKVNLQPGKYSIFIQEDEGLFANIFDGQGIINPVTVEAGKFTDIVIKVNYKAVY
jgi:hypothetical protein